MNSRIEWLMNDELIEGSYLGIVFPEVELPDREHGQDVPDAYVEPDTCIVCGGYISRHHGLGKSSRTCSMDCYMIADVYIDEVADEVSRTYGHIMHGRTNSIVSDFEFRSGYVQGWKRDGTFNSPNRDNWERSVRKFLDREWDIAPTERQLAALNRPDPIEYDIRAFQFSTPSPKWSSRRDRGWNPMDNQPCVAFRRLHFNQVGICHHCGIDIPVARRVRGKKPRTAKYCITCAPIVRNQLEAQRKALIRNLRSSVGIVPSSGNRFRKFLNSNSMNSQQLLSIIMEGVWPNQDDTRPHGNMPVTDNIYRCEECGGDVKKQEGRFEYFFTCTSCGLEPIGAQYHI
jgi:hypothetical protein